MSSLEKLPITIVMREMRSLALIIYAGPPSAQSNCPYTGRQSPRLTELWKCYCGFRKTYNAIIANSNSS